MKAEVGVLSKKLIASAVSLAIVLGLVYSNRTSLMTWAAGQGAMGFLTTLAEPILPTQTINWQISSPVSDAATDSHQTLE